MIDFTQKYDRKEWIDFLKDRFLPDDFHSKETSIQHIQKYTREVTKLGECSSLNLSVFEIKHQSQNDARVGLSKEAFALVRKYTVHNRALALFVPQNNNERYRFSFIEFTPVVTEQGKVKREYSNPRRYSYLLGKDCKRHTPETMLFTKGKVGAIEDLSSRFAIDVVTKKFYQELFDWYDKWAVNVVKFPVGQGSAACLPKNPDVEANRQHLIRLITRLIFVWFLKQKDHLIPEWIFDKDEVLNVLKSFKSDSLIDGNYYNGIIQNLFFATLNKPVTERDFAKTSSEHYGIKTYYRDHKDKSLFNISHEAFVKKFETIPFLNGGLFECLDKRDERERQQYHDGFSQESSRAAFVPNCLFWGDGNHEGLIPLFNRYNFTVEENTPQDIDIALDPELLGKVFENLLGTFNEETNSTARKESGSFYTPREIVEYMVDASLKEYLKEKVSSAKGSGASTIDELIEELFSYYAEGHHFNETQIACLIDAINDCKILDPACGSGAFPMGILHKLTFILGKLDPDNKGWKEKQLEKADSLDDPVIREKAERDIEEAFQNNELGYGRKLFLIENCIYGVDIQPIAIQISKLRFFISLIVDQKTGGTKENNYHVLPLPNLETKFVAANTLIGIEKKDERMALFENPDIEKLQKQLLDIRHRHFSAKTAKQKFELRKKDKKICADLAEMLKKEHYYTNQDAAQMAAWDPYNQNVSSAFFDPYWMFGIKDGFDVVIGNPPYGAGFSEEEKKYFLQNYKSAKTIKGKQKGSTDTFVLFIEKGHSLCILNGNVQFIVPIAITSSDSMTGLHALLEKTCSIIRVSSYAVRPQPIFQNAVVNTSILFFMKYDKECSHIFSTKMYRKNDSFNLQYLLDNLEFVDVKDLKLKGRYPKVSLDIEKQILGKIFSLPTRIGNLIKKSGKPIFYRTTGGRYFKVITNYSTGSTKEKFLYFDKKIANILGAILSSNLYFWFYQIFSNNLDLKSYEIESFSIPLEKMSEDTIKALETVYSLYLTDIEKYAAIRNTEKYANISFFKEYKIGKSKHLIDRIDDIICPLYGLTKVETEFIKNYEIEFRLDG